MLPTKNYKHIFIFLKLLTETVLAFFTSDTIKTAFWWRHNYVSST